MSIDPESFINCGTDDYYHVYVYDVEFGDGTFLFSSAGRLLLFDVADYYDWLDMEEREPFDEKRLLAAIKAKLEADYSKPVKEFALQMITKLDDCVTINADTLEEA